MEELLSREQGDLLRSIEVEVHVEVGSVLMSAEQLIDLLPGHLFEFRFEADTPVVLRVGEEIIGTARFVAIEGGLGLEILEVPEATKVESAGNELEKNGD